MKLLEITANLMRVDAMNYTRICWVIDSSTSGYTGTILDWMIGKNHLRKKEYPNVVLYYLPNTPEDVVQRVWEVDYKPDTNPRILRSKRRMRLDKNSQVA